MSRDPPGDRHFATFQVIASSLGAGFRRPEFVAERVNTPFAQRGQLGLALFN
jgi:hypothetical protein